MDSKRYGPIVDRGSPDPDRSPSDNGKQIPTSEKDASREFTVGDYFELARTHPPLAQDEAFELAKLSSAGDMDARERLVNSFLRLVVCRVRVIRDRNPHLNYLPVGELISSGQYGLLLAAKNFDASRGANFAAYAQTYIDENIKEFFRRDVSPIRIPKNFRLEKKQCTQVEESLNQSGETVSNESLLFHLNNLYPDANWTLKKVQRTRTTPINTVVVSLDQANSDGAFIEDIPDEDGSHEGSHHQIENIYTDQIQSAMSKLKKKSRLALERKYENLEPPKPLLDKNAQANYNRNCTRAEEKLFSILMSRNLGGHAGKLLRIFFEEKSKMKASLDLDGSTSPEIQGQITAHESVPESVEDIEEDEFSNEDDQSPIQEAAFQPDESSEIIQSYESTPDTQPGDSTSDQYDSSESEQGGAQ